MVSKADTLVASTHEALPLLGSAETGSAVE